MRIDTSDVVPGDILILGEGDSVSADGRLLAAASCVSRSQPDRRIRAGREETRNPDSASQDRMNMVFNGTSVT